MAIFPTLQGSQKPLHITVILGTVRQGRESERVAHFILNILKRHPSVTTELVDVRNFHFPHDGYGRTLKDLFPDYAATVQRSDGFVIVTPEYNHGYPGTLKTLLDLLLPEYNHRAVGVIGVSSGPWGGARVVENLLPVLRELGLVTSRLSMNIYKAEEAFSVDGSPQDPSYAVRADKFLTELLWLATALRWGRTNL